jgi:hypothetical protein
MSAYYPFLSRLRWTAAFEPSLYRKARSVTRLAPNFGGDGRGRADGDQTAKPVSELDSPAMQAEQ